MNGSKIAAICCVTVASLLTAVPVSGAGFQISETSVIGLGRAFAGNGVGGDSLSDMFANPASLSLRQGMEIEFGLYALSTSAQFINSDSSRAFGSLTVPAQGGNSDGGGNSLIPNLYVAGDINDNMRWGVGITSPFGLATEYDRGWVGRYAALKSELITIEVNPGISIDMGATSFGIGLTLLRAEAELTNARFTGRDSPDAVAKIAGSDTSTGWTMGILGENRHGRVGVSMRSRVKLEVDGALSIASLGVNAGASTEVVLPKTYYLSGLYHATDRLDILGSLRITDWQEFKELRIDFDNGLPPSITPQNWHSTTTVSLGFNYATGGRWSYRGGIAYDEGAVDDADRNARIPESDRMWVSFGGSYQATDRVRVDFGYARIMADRISLDETNVLAPGVLDNVRGSYTETDANLLGISVAVRPGR